MAIDRRAFVKTAGMAAAAVMLPRPSWSQSAGKFKLNYAPHFGMFREHAPGGLVAELEFMASEGFRALEDNNMRTRSVADQELIGKTLQRLNMTMGVFVAHTISWRDPTLTTRNPEHRDAFLKEIRESVDIAKRITETWMVVVPGTVDARPHIDYQTANVIETLKRAAAILEPHNLVLVLEPLNTFRNHPGIFVTRAPQIYMLCKAVGSPACKMLFDTYHEQIQEGNIIPNIDASWDEIVYVQVGDNPGRNEPGTGEMNYRNIFKHLHGKGYAGIVGMEHGNSIKGKEGERAVINAYAEADRF